MSKKKKRVYKPLSPEQMKKWEAYRVLRTEARKAEFFTAHGPCQDCGGDKALHAYNTSKKNRKLNLWGLSDARRHKALRTHIVVCGACLRNRIAKKQNSHGIKSYRAGCRCLTCRMGYRIYETERRLSQRLTQVEKTVTIIMDVTDALQGPEEKTSLPKPLDERAPGSLLPRPLLPLWEDRDPAIASD